MTTHEELSAAEEYWNGHAPLIPAALDGNTEKAKELIHQGADINQRELIEAERTLRRKSLRQMQ